MPNLLPLSSHFSPGAVGQGRLVAKCLATPAALCRWTRSRTKTSLNFIYVAYPSMLRAASGFTVWKGYPPTGGSWPESTVILMLMPLESSSFPVVWRSRLSTHAICAWLDNKSSSIIMYSTPASLSCNAFSPWPWGFSPLLTGSSKRLWSVPPAVSNAAFPLAQHAWLCCPAASVAHTLVKIYLCPLSPKIASVEVRMLLRRKYDGWRRVTLPSVVGSSGKARG